MAMDAAGLYMIHSEARKCFSEGNERMLGQKQQSAGGGETPDGDKDSLQPLPYVTMAQQILWSGGGSTLMNEMNKID